MHFKDGIFVLHLLILLPINAVEFDIFMPSYTCLVNTTGLLGIASIAYIDECQRLLGDATQCKLS